MRSKSLVLFAVVVGVFNGCGVEMGSITPSIFQSTSSVEGCKQPDSRSTNALTKKIESALHDSSGLKGCCVFADMDGNNVKLTGVVKNEKQKYVASAVANSYAFGRYVVNRVEIYKPQAQTLEKKPVK